MEVWHVTGSNIYKRKDGRWEGRYQKGYRENGSIAYGYVYGKTCTEAKELLRMRQAHSIQPASHGGATFAEVAQIWQMQIALRVKRSTYARYAEALDLHILPALGGQKLSRLSSEHFSQFARVKMLSGRLDGQGGLAAKTVRDLLSTIKSILDFAKREGYIVADISMPYPRTNQQEMRVLSKKEQMALEDVLVAEGNPYKMGILLSLYTGLRLGEVCALQWQDISLEERIVYVRKTTQRIRNMAQGGPKTVTVIDTPKSRTSVRRIPLSQFLVDYLRPYAQQEEVFVLSGVREQPADLRTLQNHFKRYVAQAGIEDANFHALRHTFATRCMEAGVDLKSLSEMLGHAHINITLSRYVHSSMAQKREGVDKLAKYMNA